MSENVVQERRLEDQATGQPTEQHDRRVTAGNIKGARLAGLTFFRYARRGTPSSSRRLPLGESLSSAPRLSLW